MLLFTLTETLIEIAYYTGALRPYSSMRFVMATDGVLQQVDRSRWADTVTAKLSRFDESLCNAQGSAVIAVIAWHLRGR